MLSTALLSRAQAAITPFNLAQDVTTRLVNAIQPAPHVTFAGARSGERQRFTNEDAAEIAHTSGVNALVIDRFEGRYLLSGGADGSVSLWDLETATPQQDSYRPTARPKIVHIPLSNAPKSNSTHTHGVTSVSFFPFDSLAFTTSSYDHSLKIWDSTTFKPSASFAPSESPIYSHAVSPIASHLLVACATQHPAIRLVDLNSGASTHTLVGHTGGAVLSVAWSPRDDHILASGGMDGMVRLWDVRRSAGCLAVMDAEDGVGVVGYNGVGMGARSRFRGQAHTGPVNGLVWTDNGRFLVSTAHDEKIRVWDCHSGANTLASFGPAVRNRTMAGVIPLLVPKGVVRGGEEIMFYPNEKEILVFDLFEGTTVKKLKAPGLVASASQRESGGGTRNVRERVTALAWRFHDVEMVSGHGDGTIRSWQPRTLEDAFVEESETLEDEAADSTIRKRKRQVLEDIEREVANTRHKVTFR